jgi:hypothetical protein
LGKFAGKVKQVYNSGPEIALREKKRVGISYILDKNNSYYEMIFFFFFVNKYSCQYFKMNKKI